MTEFNRNELKHRTLSEFRTPELPVAEPASEYDDGDDYEERGFFAKFRLIAPIIIIASICFVSYAWYTDKFAISRSNADIPVIKAITAELREKPEDPGGMKIINRDKRVYETISGNDNTKDKKPERILPGPEEPISREEIAEKSTYKSSSEPEIITQNNQPKDKDAKIVPKVTEATVKPVEAKPDTTNIADIAPAAAAATKQTSATETGSKAENKDKETTLAAQSPETKPAAAVKKPEKQEVTTADITDVNISRKITKTAPQKIPTGYRVQIGSYRSMGDAEISWKSINMKFPEITGNLHDYIEKADLGSKGMFYRLQLAGFKNEADARKACQNLIQKKQECFFVGK